MGRHTLKFALLLGLVVFALPGCKKKKAGDKCNDGNITCVGASQALFCNGGKYAAMSCAGPLGCTTNGPDDIDCDNSIAAEKDGCNKKDDVACASDHKSVFECDGTTFTLASSCKGPKGCLIKDENITCDNDVSDLGDPCHFDGDYACSSDKTLAMKCIGKKMTALNSCRGPKGCQVHEKPDEKKTDFVCDDSIANAGDPCDEENEEACSADKKELYACKGGKFAHLKNCHGPNGCQFNESTDKYSCDKGK